MRVYKGNNVLVKDWTTSLEEGAQKQVDNLASLPFAFHHVAIMPDAHSGYGMPIGGVLATTNVIIPNAVGVDIGCGVQSAYTDIVDISKQQVEDILDEMAKLIPVGFNHHKDKQGEDFTGFSGKIWEQEKDFAQYSVGTLGGGNHFLEIQRHNTNIALMVHSGSRNLGYKICDHYNKLAKEINEKYYSSVPLEYDLAFLPLDTQEARDYIEDMNTAMKFATINRRNMILAMVEASKKVMGDFHTIHYTTDTIHNYAQLENHYGKNVMVHRKGAIRVKKKELALIPGSMGTASYVVKGLGNQDSFMSASHGAGRRFSRTQANATITPEVAKESMGDIVYRVGSDDRSEFPGAYKDIEEVMDNQKDLVEKVVKLTPIGVLKG